MVDCGGQTMRTIAGGVSGSISSILCCSWLIWLEVTGPPGAGAIGPLYAVRPSYEGATTFQTQVRRSAAVGLELGSVSFSDEGIDPV
jgi:hypothetical protein